MISLARALQQAKADFSQHAFQPLAVAELIPAEHALDMQQIEWLLLEVLQQNQVYLRMYPDQLLTAAQYQQFQANLQRLQKGEPLAYIIGHQAFWTLDLLVSPATLIPRPDTERLVEEALTLFDAQSSIRVLDLGTGTGAIALSLAAERPHWQVTATDFSEAALQVARQNAQRHQLGHVRFKQGSWFAALADCPQQSGQQWGQQFELIVSNPPYIDPDDQHLPLLTHEPITALVAQQHGLADIAQIIADAPQWLADKGWLVLEHGYDQAAQVRQLFTSAGFSQVYTVQDYGQQDRVTLGCYSNDTPVL